MHHAALDGARAHDGHLDDQIVEALGKHARQHGHLRAGFDLEHAYGVGALDHRVDLGVLRRHRGHAELPVAMLGDQIEALVDGRQHAERQHVHLEQAQGLQIVLVPLDDGAIRHGGILDGHQR